MPNQSDPNSNQPVNPPTSQPTGPPVPPIASIQADLPPLPPDFSTVSGSSSAGQDAGSNTPIAPPINPPPDSAAPPGLSPVISSKPKKKFGGGRVIATILGVLLLVGGVGAGIFLTQQQQDVREKAYTQVWGGENICDLVKVTAVEDPFCSEVCGPGNSDCSGHNDIGNKYSTTFTLANLTDEPHVIEYIKYTYFCPNARYGDDNGICLENETAESGTVTLQGKGSASYLAEITGLFSAKGRSCGTYQTDFKVISIDGKSDCRSLDPLALAFGMCKTGRFCVGDYIPPATTTPTALCQDVKAYSSTWTLLTNAQLSALAPNTIINFCVAGTTSTGSFDKAQFKINTTLEAETTTPRPGATNEFCQSYTIKSTDTTVNVQAKINHTTLGWQGEAI